MRVVVEKVALVDSCYFHNTCCCSQPPDPDADTLQESKHDWGSTNTRMFLAQFWHKRALSSSCGKAASRRTPGCYHSCIGTGNIGTGSDGIGTCTDTYSTGTGTGTGTDTKQEQQLC